MIYIQVQGPIGRPNSHPAAVPWAFYACAAVQVLDVAVLAQRAAHVRADRVDAEDLTTMPQQRHGAAKDLLRTAETTIQATSCIVHTFRLRHASLCAANHAWFCAHLHLQHTSPLRQLSISTHAHRPCRRHADATALSCSWPSNYSREYHCRCCNLRDTAGAAFAAGRDVRDATASTW